MLEVLYYIFIFPIEGLLDFLLYRMSKISNNYGLGIIYLSILLNLLLLKLSFYFEAKAKKFNTLKKQCNSKIAEFKRVFKGAELQSYIRILYRQKGFHPIFALSGLGGLALQIPFFIAMIHLVENAGYLQEVRFLWITDLSKPDSITLLGFSIHLLPILMTLFTLINVFYSSKELGARIQGSVIALLFLVLLYSMPSALVLYWTCNMVFALGRSVLGNSSLGNHLRNPSAPLHCDARPSASHSQGETISQSRTANTRIVDLAVAKNKPSNSLDSEISESSTPPNASTQKAELPKLKYLFNTIFTPHNALSPKDYKLYRNISILAILNICFMICVFSPYAVYSSDVSQFDVNQTYQTLGALFGVFLTSSLIIIYLTSFFYKTRLFVFGVYIVSILLIMGLANTFIFVGDYGAMDHFVLQKPEFNSKWRFLYAFLAIGLGVIIAWRFLRYLKSAFMIILLTLSAMSVMDAVKISQTNEIYKPQKIAATNDSEVPYENELFSYSKTEKNIVVIVMDTFSASHGSMILNQFPEFREKLDGFVMFDNTLSTTNSTIHSIATLIGGEHYAVYNMNARKDNLADSITEAYGIIGDTFIKNGYDVSYFLSVPAKDPKYITEYNKNIIEVEEYNRFEEYYVGNKPYLSFDIEQQMLGNSIEIRKFLGFGFFRISVEMLRSKIYNRAKWIKFGRISNIDDYIRGAIRQDSLVFAISNIHNSNAKKPTFKFFHTVMTHMPFAIYYDGGKCTYFTKNTALTEYPHKSLFYTTDEVKESYFQHYDHELCALDYVSNFIAWLKKEGIYDNTQIFVVSDHGAFGTRDIPKFILDAGGRPEAMLLFKDFNQKGELRIDKRLMANYDVVSIFCSNLPNGCPNVPQNILQNYPNNRSIIITMPQFWELHKHKKHEWLINRYFQVKGDIYNKNSYKDITESVKNGTFKIDGINH